jgi:Cu(I)/Ag(I) efflux system membrane fusion protein
MTPAQHFDQPGKSPYMDMALQPRYADEGGAQDQGVHVDARLVQSLGVRIATVESADVASSLEVPGTVVFDERQTAVVQARTAGLVSRTYARAPGDVLARGAPLAELLVPEWTGAQAEYLALVRTGDPELQRAGRQRLLSMGMPESLVEQVRQSGQTQATFTVTTPIAGVIDALDVREGMSLAAGSTLATVRGIDPVWVEAAVPEAQAAAAAAGGNADVQVAGGAVAALRGRILAVLPSTNADSHSLRVRIELPNPAGRLRPGMFARVTLGSVQHRHQLLIPTESLIRTGMRTLVIVALSGDRFEPVEVQAGPEYGGLTAIVAGLQEGQRVVSAGQFLFDSEASLRGVAARMLPSATGAPR